MCQGYQHQNLDLAAEAPLAAGDVVPAIEGAQRRLCFAQGDQQAGDDQGVNRAVVRALFATAPGAVAEEVVQVGDAFAVVGTDEVIAADPGADAEGVSQLERELEAEMRSDLIAQFEAQLRRDYPVEIDGAAINRLIQADGAVPAAPSRSLPSGLF